MQHIIKHLFRVDTLEEVPRVKLEELVKEHPSFGIGRYLLSSKLHAENDGHFTEETLKTNLYFNNPFWLQWLLLQAEVYTAPEPAYEPPPPVYETPAEDPTPSTPIHDEEPAPVWETPEAPLPESPAVASAADLLLQSIAEMRGHREALAQQETAGEKAEVLAEPEPPSIALVAMALEQAEESAPAAETTPAITGETPIHDEEPAFILEEPRIEEGTPVEEPVITPEEAFIPPPRGNPPGCSSPVNPCRNTTACHSAQFINGSHF